MVIQVSPSPPIGGVQGFFRGTFTPCGPATDKQILQERQEYSDFCEQFSAGTFYERFAILSTVESDGCVPSENDLEW